MKYLLLISIIFGLICPIKILATVNSSMKVSVEQKKSEKKTADINSTAITLETLYALIKNVDEKSKESIAIRCRIDKLENLKKGIRPSFSGLSYAQAQIIKDVFVLENPEESIRRQQLLKGHDKLKNIQSFDEFKRVAMNIINNK